MKPSKLVVSNLATRDTCHLASFNKMAMLIIPYVTFKDGVILSNGDITQWLYKLFFTEDPVPSFS